MGARLRPLSETISVDSNGCWVFNGAKQGDGYGTIRRGGKTLLMHRWMYAAMRGEVNAETLDHLCRNRACCNPDHLEPVSKRENALRGDGPSATHARQESCVNGHEFTAENTYLWKKASGLIARSCRTCGRKASLAYSRRIATVGSTIALALLLALPLAAQDAAYKLTQTAVRLDGGAGGTGFSTPTGCVATSVPVFLGSPVALGCDAGLTYDSGTDILTAGGFKIVAGAGIGKVLVSDVNGVGAWGAAGAAGAGGADTQIQYNDAGTLNGHAGFTLAKASGAVSLTAPFTLTPGSDIVPLTVRAYSSGTSHIAQFQASDNTPLSHISHTGVFVGNVTGTASAATAAADGLTSASGTAPLTLTLAAKGLTGSVAEFTGDAGAGGTKGLVPAPAAGDAAKFLRGDKTWAAGGGGVTNSAGANVITKSDGTNVVATALSEASAGAIATSAGTALGLTATAPAATTGASQAGKAVTITASPAVASTDTAGAAAGGSVTITAGAAARNTSGDGAGGDVIAVPGAKIGNGRVGGFCVGNNSSFGLMTGQSYGFLFGIAETGAIRAYIGGTNTDGGVVVSSGSQLGFASNTSPTFNNLDTFMRRRAAANPAWGVASATPVAYTHSLAADARAGTDTNTRGAKATQTPGIGTGTGGSGDFVLQTAPPGTTGTAANTPADRIVLASKPVALTESSATAILDYAVASGTVAGGTVWYTIRADDATDFQALRGQLQWAAVNKAGTLTATVGLVGSEVLAASTGTLTNTATITTGTNSITINLNAVSSLTQTTLYAFVSAEIDGTGVATTK